MLVLLDILWDDLWYHLFTTSNHLPLPWTTLLHTYTSHHWYPLLFPLISTIITVMLDLQSLIQHLHHLSEVCCTILVILWFSVIIKDVAHIHLLHLWWYTLFVMLTTYSPPTTHLFMWCWPPTDDLHSPTARYLWTSFLGVLPSITIITRVKCVEIGSLEVCWPRITII